MEAAQAEIAREYLQAHHVLCLATSDGLQPWVSPVFYALWRESLIFLSAPHTRHAKNIKSNPLVSASVQEDYNNWKEIRGLQLEGTARIVEAEDRSDVVDCYTVKFPVTGVGAPPEIAKALNRVEWYQLEISLVYFIDNSKGLGYREELNPQEVF